MALLAVHIPSKFVFLDPEAVTEIHDSRLDEDQVQEVDDVHDIVSNHPLGDVQRSLVWETYTKRQHPAVVCVRHCYYHQPRDVELSWTEKMFEKIIFKSLSTTVLRFVHFSIICIPWGSRTDRGFFSSSVDFCSSPLSATENEKYYGKS